MQLQGKLLIRADGVRLLLSPYRQSLAGGKGAVKRRQAQIQALSKETGLPFGCVRQLRDGSSEALLGSEQDCYPAGELVYEALGQPERLFYAEEIAPDTFVVIAALDRRVVLDEIAAGDEALLSSFELATSQFADQAFTLAVNAVLREVLPTHAHAVAQIVPDSLIETAAVLSVLRFRAVAQLASKQMSPSRKKALAMAAGVALVAFGGYFYVHHLRQDEAAQETAVLSAMKHRTLDPLADYKRSMATLSADTFISQLDVLIYLTSSGRGWIPSHLEYTNGEPLKIAFTSFGGTRTQLVQQVRVRNALFAQVSQGTVLLVDMQKLPGRERVPQLEPLSKVLFETLDALDAHSMGVLKVQVGEMASFGQWSSQKIQLTVTDAPLAFIKLLAKTLAGRPVNLTQADLSLEGQSLSGVIHLDVFGS
jgi:hypothetical protein